MASPLDPSTPTNLSSPGLGDDEFRAIKQWLVDVFGVPVSPTAVAAAGLLFSSAGLTKLILQNLGGDPAAIGEIGRNGNSLEFYDTAVRKLLHDGHQQLKFKTANEGYAIQSILHNDNALFFPVEINTRYAFELRAWYQPQTTSQTVTLTMAGPAGSTGLWDLVGFVENATYGVMPITGSLGITRTTVASTSVLPLHISGHISVGATAGNLQFQWTGNAGQTMNVFAGSWIKLEKVP